MELLVLKQTLTVTNTVVRWVSSDRQLADGLSKPSARISFLSWIRGGKYRLVYDGSFTAAKKKTATQRLEDKNECVLRVETKTSDSADRGFRPNSQTGGQTPITMVEDVAYVSLVSCVSVPCHIRTLTAATSRLSEPFAQRSFPR